MASSCTTGAMATTFSRCAPVISRTTQHLRPSRAPTTWASWTTTARDRALGTALVSTTTRRNRTPPACKRPGSSGTNRKELLFDVTLPADAEHFEQNLVMRMREMLMDENNPFVVYQIARLREQGDDPELMNLTLLAGEARVTLSVRTDNLYVVGFRNGKGRWFEFDHADRRAPMIKGSTHLPFAGAYNRGGIGDLSANDPILGFCSVVDAIGGLATYDGTNDDHVKDWLRTLMVNFIEPVRFDAIADRAASQMRSKSNPSQASMDRRLSARNIELISRWGNISRDSVQAVTDWSSWRSWGVNSLANVGRVLGMALVSRPARNKRPHRAVHDDEDSGGVVGLTLAEVVGVVIGNINGCDPGKLYGTITLADGFGAVQLYNRDKGGYQKVGPGGKADLHCPPRPVSGADDFVIDVDLMDHYEYSSWIKSDRKVALGQVAWNSRDALSRDYNTILKVPVKAQHGEVEVQYAVLTDAVVATVEVVMVDSGNFYFSPDVYGSVTATTSMASSGSGEQLQYILFDKARGEYQKVSKEKAIPLERKLVSTPLCSKLEVSADLWDDNMVVSDKQIVNGCVDFTPRLAGTMAKEITGPRGKVMVKVTWSASFSTSNSGRREY